MKKFFTIVLFLLLHSSLFAQQFSQYNTGTLYDSFENPSEKSFVPDSSRNVGFNLFVPNFNTDFVLTGNAQKLFKRRVFSGRYDESTLQLGQGRLNYVNANVNAYAFMLKIYTSVDGDKEIGMSIQTRGEGRGVFSDEAAQFLGNNDIYGNQVTNVLNMGFNYQAYHQIGFTFRTSLDEHFSFGVKLSGLLGIVYNKSNIYHSSINFDRGNDRAFISLAGKYYASFEPGKFEKSDLLPTTKNPGASVSLGATYIANDGTKMQWNIKDLGFIHWNKLSLVGAFNNTGVVRGLSTIGYEDSLFKTVASIVQSQSVKQSFTSPTDGHAEFSVSKSYWLGYNSIIKYTPTVILSKQLFYTGFTGALVNHFQYSNLVATLTGSYDDRRVFNFGGQLMIKSPNTEFFIGCDRLLQTTSLLCSALNNNSSQVSKDAQSSGANFYMGFSIKLGTLIEHQANSSTVPMSERRPFIKRFWQRITGNGD